MLGLIVHYFPNHPFAVNVLLRRRVVDAAERMGQALQYINVARDIVLDVAINRVYLPTTWLNEQGLCPTDLLVFPTDPRLESVRERLLERADFLSASARSEIAFLPREVQGPLLALVDSYLEIGAALRRGMRPRKAGEKLKLPIGRRLWVAYRAMALRR
jgi:15-cis-phytoene synthase/lycopene beta-cyclase